MNNRTPQCIIWFFLKIAYTEGIVAERDSSLFCSTFYSRFVHFVRLYGERIVKHAICLKDQFGLVLKGMEFWLIMSFFHRIRTYGRSITAIKLCYKYERFHIISALVYMQNNSATKQIWQIKTLLEYYTIYCYFYVIVEGIIKCISNIYWV